MRLYKFCPSKFGMENLKKRRLKISIFDKLNDPFELNPYRIESREDRLLWEKAMRDTANGKGLICFSDRWSNPVIWSHYAENHTGMCLGFDVCDTDCFKVAYKSKKTKLPPISTIVKDRNTAFIEEALLTKYSHWRYEHEWRMFLSIGTPPDSNGNYFEPFGEKIKLREVIVGHSCEINIDELRALCSGDISFIKARLAFITFSVVPWRNFSDRGRKH
jgi:hypothetical protein